MASRSIWEILGKEIFLKQMFRFIRQSFNAFE